MGACGKPPSSSDHVHGLPSPWEDHADVTFPRSRCLLLSQGSVPWQQPWCRVQGWGGHGDMQDEGTLVDGSVPRPPAGLTHWSPGRRQLSTACGSVSSPERLSPVATLAWRAAREEGLSWAKPGWCGEGVLGSQGPNLCISPLPSPYPPISPDVTAPCQQRGEGRKLHGSPGAAGSKCTHLFVQCSAGGANHLSSLILIIGFLSAKHLQLQLTATSKTCLGSLEGKTAFSVCIRAPSHFHSHKHRLFYPGSSSSAHLGSLP